MPVVGTSLDIDTNPHQGPNPGPKVGPGHTGVYLPRTKAEVEAVTGYTLDFGWDHTAGTAAGVTLAGGQNFSQIVACDSYVQDTPWCGITGIQHGLGEADRVGLAGSNSHPSMSTESWMVVFVCHDVTNSSLNRGGIYKHGTDGYQLFKISNNDITLVLNDSTDADALNTSLTSANRKTDCMVAIAYGLDQGTNEAFVAQKGGGMTASATGNAVAIDDVSNTAYFQTSNGNSWGYNLLATWVFIGDSGYRANVEATLNKIL